MRQNTWQGEGGELSTLEEAFVQALAAIGSPSVGTALQAIRVNAAGNGFEYFAVSSGMSNPMTTLGDIIYGAASGTATRLAGNATTTKKFLTQTGDGANSAAPGWNIILDADVPSALTGKSYNGLTLTAQAVGFTIAGGTTSKTLTVALDASVSGTNTGDQTSVSGNAGTATALQTARTIGGVSFNGTADITVSTATAGFTVSGGNLALGANSLTMTGSIAATGSRVTKGWFTDIESTNMPTVGGTAILTSLTAPQFTTIELGHASDSTISRVSAGVLAVEGKNIALNGTSEVLTTGTIELGAASDTTLSRVSAGVIAVEGVTVPTISSTNTFTNKRFTPRITTITSSATPTINTDNCDAVTITALAAAITSMTTNLSGTPNNFDTLIIRIKDDGTARAITWGTGFEAKGVALPTTTVISKVLTVGFIYDSVTSKWGCVASAQEA